MNFISLGECFIHEGRSVERESCTGMGVGLLRYVFWGVGIRRGYFKGCFLLRVLPLMRQKWSRIGHYLVPIGLSSGQRIQYLVLILVWLPFYSDIYISVLCETINSSRSSEGIWVASSIIKYKRIIKRILYNNKRDACCWNIIYGDTFIWISLCTQLLTLLFRRQTPLMP